MRCSSVRRRDQAPARTYFNGPEFGVEDSNARPARLAAPTALTLQDPHPSGGRPRCSVSPCGPLLAALPAGAVPPVHDYSTYATPWRQEVCSEGEGLVGLGPLPRGAFTGRPGDPGDPAPAGAGRGGGGVSAPRPLAGTFTSVERGTASGERASGRTAVLPYCSCTAEPPYCRTVEPFLVLATTTGPSPQVTASRPGPTGGRFREVGGIPGRSPEVDGA